MALQKELLVRLNNEGEPLTKRLRLAKNAFQTNELPVHRKENIIFNWFCNNISTESEVWGTFAECLGSEKMTKLNIGDLDSELKQNIIQLISKQLKSKKISVEMNNEVLKCALFISTNESMYYYFKSSPKRYSQFLSLVLCKIKNAEHAIQVLDSIFAVYKTFLDKDKFYFIIITAIVASSKMLINLNNNQIVFNHTSKTIEKILFSHILQDTHKSALNIFFSSGGEIKQSILLDVFMKLQKIYETDRADIVLNAFKLIFHSFLNSYKLNSQIMCQLFVLINYLIGFKIEKLSIADCVPKIEKIDIELSLTILNSYLAMMSNLQMDDVRIGDLTFDVYIQDLILQIIEMSNIPLLITFDIFCNIIKLNPVALEDKLNEVIIYTTMCHKKTPDHLKEYTKFMRCLLEMFSKLHREQKFISKLLKCLNNTLNPENTASNLLKYIELNDVLPPAVCTYFGNLIENFSSSQSVATLKTFNFQLSNDVVKAIKPLKPDSTIVLLTQIEVQLFIVFLNNVTIAEHTVLPAALERFLHAMDELKSILAEFGNTLLNMEHNCELMTAYLDLCYTWGELSVLILHYAPHVKSLNISVMTNDISPRNFTYLHSYLSADQWNSIAQRIHNFGEYKCKRLMHKFLMQKIRTMLLFNIKISNEMKVSYNKSLIENMQETKSLVMSESDATSDCVLPLLETPDLIQFSEHFMNGIIETGNYKILSRDDFQDRRKFVSANIAACIIKLSSIFKMKRKHDENNLPFTSLMRKITSEIDFNLFVNEDEEYLPGVIEKISKYFDEDFQPINTSKIDFDLLKKCLQFFTQLPVSYCSKHVKTIIFLLCFALRTDLKNVNGDEEYILYCENLLIDALEGENSPNILLHVNYEKFFEKAHVCKHFDIIVLFLIGNYLKNEDCIAQFKGIIKYLKRNINLHPYCLQILTIVLNCIRKSKKGKYSAESKILLNKYRHKCCKIFIKLVESEHAYKPKDLIEPYGLVLQNSYSENSKKQVDKLLVHLKVFLNYAFSQNDRIEVSWKFVEVLLKYKKEIGVHMPKNFVLKCQELCKKSEKSSMSLLFETANNEQFKILLDNLLNDTKRAMLSNDNTEFEKKLNIWKSIITSNLNIKKSHFRQNSLGELFHEILFYTKNTPMDNIGPQKKVLHLAANLIEKNKISISGSLIDTILLIVSNVQLSTTKEIQSYAELFLMTLQVLDLLFAYRNAMVLDILPSFLVRLKYLLSSLCERSDVNNELKSEDISSLAKCAYGIEKLIIKMAKHKKDLVRLSPYIVANILNYYEKITFYLPVKTHLNNCIYVLINICDAHAMPFLNRNLSIASKELFKKAYGEFKKYYRFVGKI